MSNGTFDHQTGLERKIDARRLVMLALGGLGLFLVIQAWRDTTATPVVHEVSIELKGFPPRSAPLTVVLLSDIHVAGPDMPPERLEKIVDQINALKPDVILIAGDFVSDKRTATRLYTAKEALTPLGRLDPDAIKLAVPGNHDHWRDIHAVEHELARHRIGVLRNEVVNAGGLIIAGLDDDFTGRADLDAVLPITERFNRQALVLSHSPDPFPDLTKDFGLMLAGHTHCGQIRYPWGGSPATMSDYGDKYACGIAEENGNTLITTAGLGTSVLPIRLFSRAEIWHITIRPPNP